MNHTNNETKTEGNVFGRKQTIDQNLSQYNNSCFTIKKKYTREIQVSPFQAQLGRLPKKEFNFIRDNFMNNSDYLDKQKLEGLAWTASQIKRRIGQSRENLKIIRRGDLDSDTSPMYKQQLSTDRDRQRAKALKELSEANARRNEERRDAAKNGIVYAAGQSNPNFRKKMKYSWEKGFIKDKEEEPTRSPKKTYCAKTT